MCSETTSQQPRTGGSCHKQLSIFNTSQPALYTAHISGGQSSKADASFSGQTRKSLEAKLPCAGNSSSQPKTLLAHHSTSDNWCDRDQFVVTGEIREVGNSETGEQTNKKDKENPSLLALKSDRF